MTNEQLIDGLTEAFMAAIPNNRTFEVKSTKLLPTEYHGNGVKFRGYSIIVTEDEPEARSVLFSYPNADLVARYVRSGDAFAVTALEWSGQDDNFVEVRFGTRGGKTLHHYPDDARSINAVKAWLKADETRRERTGPGLANMMKNWTASDVRDAG